jgi:hypothetical protein
MLACVADSFRDFRPVRRDVLPKLILELYDDIRRLRVSRNGFDCAVTRKARQNRPHEIRFDFIETEPARFTLCILPFRPQRAEKFIAITYDDIVKRRSATQVGFTNNGAKRDRHRALVT